VTGRRTREIGVRKTLGASTGRILRLLLLDFSKPVLIANLIAWPVAYIAAKAYLAIFFDPVSLTPAPFLLSLVITLLVAWASVGLQSWRAARAKPAGVLRHE
jgi:putative ABC transport system permease protein